MPAWLRVVVGLLLLPLCAGGISALFRVLSISGHALNFWVAFAGGAACWFAIFTLMPRPLWVYVLGHELTHAVWAWIFGGRVKRFKVSSRGGHVVLTKSNFLIVLAPYFFPIYSVMVVLIFALGNWLWDWRGAMVLFHLLLGATYAFHLTLTWSTLAVEQSDITSQGYFFSAVVILFGNLAVLLLGLPALVRVPVGAALRWWMRETGRFYQVLGQIFGG